VKIFILIFLSIISLYSKDILGQIDKFDLPLLNLTNIEARIDTGATTSSLYCTSIKQLDENTIEFKVLDKQIFIRPIFRVSKVKSSNGEIEKRYFIKTDIIIFDKKYELELSLANRVKMKYPLLIGRELLLQDFIVDVSQQNLSYNKKTIINYKE